MTRALPAGTLASVVRRLRSPDVLQVLGLFLAAQLFIIAVRWPGQGGSNETWFALAQARLLMLALASLAYGAAEQGRDRASRAATLGALVAFAALSAPFDIACYAASYPAVPLWWSAALAFPETVAYFGLGLALGRAAAWARLGALLPLLVPAVLVAAVWLDVRTGVNALDPLTAPLAVAPVHGVVVLVLSGLTLFTLAPRRVSAGADAPPREDA